MIHRLCLTIAVSLTLYGCETAPDAGNRERSVPAAHAGAGDAVGADDAAGHDRNASERADRSADTRPAAMINGRAVSWGELRPLLSEAAGAEILREVALDRVLEEIAQRRGVNISEEDVAAERRLMRKTLAHDDPDRAVRLLNELRQRTGLGERRFQALLRRNATLRALIRDRVQITDAAVRQMFDAVHGPRRQVRLITLPSLTDIRRAITRIEAGEPFSDVAVDVSTDASASRGGLLEPISRFDPSYPDALRRAIWELSPGEISSPLMLDEQYAVIQLQREIEGNDVDLDDVRDAIAERVRLAQERMHMDQFARQLIADVSINIFDESLRESWEMQRQRRRTGVQPGL